MIAHNGICTITEVAKVPPGRRRRESFWRYFTVDIMRRLEQTTPPRALRLEFANRKAADVAKRGMYHQSKVDYGPGCLRIMSAEEGVAGILYVQRGKNWRKP